MIQSNVGIMSQLAPSTSLVLSTLLVLCSVVTLASSQLTLRASPPAQDNLLCPGPVTFTCSSNEVEGLGTGIRWFFNNNSTRLFPFLYFTGMSYPLTEVNNSFVVVVVESATLSTMFNDVVNAVVHLTVNSLELVEDNNVYRLSCGREYNFFVRSINITGIDTRPPKLEPMWTVCYQDNQLQDVQVTFREIYPVFNCDFKSSNVSFNTTGTVRTISDECLRNSEATCSYQISNISLGDMVQLNVFNAVGSANNSYTVVSPSFNLTSSADNTNCMLSVQCLSISSPEDMIDCEISVTDAQSSSVSAEMTSTGPAQYSVVANSDYYIEASYGSANDRMVKIRQMFTTGSCEPEGEQERRRNVGASVGGTISVVVAVVVMMIIITSVTVVRQKKRRNGCKNRAEEGQGKGETNQLANTGASNPTNQEISEEYAETISQELARKQNENNDGATTVNTGSEPMQPAGEQV